MKFYDWKLDYADDLRNLNDTQTNRESGNPNSKPCLIESYFKNVDVDKTQLKAVVSGVF